jgi:heterodisulfide reductase subunit A-like polyferredoxin
MEMERLSGIRTDRRTPGAQSDHKEPKKMAWFQCVGSRDMNRCDNSYCSSVCCMYAIKEAVIAKEHAGDLDCAIFYMDMRTHGKDFERFLQQGQGRWRALHVRSRVHTIDPVRDSAETCPCAMWTTPARWVEELRHDCALHRPADPA